MHKTICRGCVRTEVGYLPEVRISRVRKSGVRAKEAIFSKWSILEDTANNGCRRMLYRQMAIRTNGDELLGKGNRVQLPECVLSGVRELFPSDDGEYMGHRDA
jgi:hypothetical protein